MNFKEWKDAFENKGCRRCKVIQTCSADQMFSILEGDVLPIVEVSNGAVFVKTTQDPHYPMDVSQIEPYLTSVRLDVSSNPHYQTAVQPIETMQANMTREELIGFLKGNIIKYVCRCGRKDDVPKETAKIKQYAEWLDEVANGRQIVIEHKEEK